MSKIMIWVGQFDSEADFEKYMDQSAFRQWWKEYDEDNKELRCQFCKELVSMWFIGGIITTGVGITGVYIGKIYTEVKRRPRYFIEERV